MMRSYGIALATVLLAAETSAVSITNDIEQDVGDDVGVDFSNL